MIVSLYLVAVILANQIITHYGPGASVITAFVLIGLDLTSRDILHEAWKGRGLWPKMLALIGAGSLLSYLLNANAGPIALASFTAFLLAGLADTAVYWLLGEKSRLLRINGSNVVASAMDSLIFPALAFGWPLLWWIVLGQFAAKVLGGFLWSLVLNVRSRVMVAVAE